jgi:hypothetical protein
MKTLWKSAQAHYNAGVVVLNLEVVGLAPGLGAETVAFSGVKSLRRKNLQRHE